MWIQFSASACFYMKYEYLLMYKLKCLYLLHNAFIYVADPGIIWRLVACEHCHRTVNLNPQFSQVLAQKACPYCCYQSKLLVGIMHHSKNWLWPLAGGWLCNKVLNNVWSTYNISVASKRSPWFSTIMHKQVKHKMCFSGQPDVSQWCNLKV